MTKEITRVTSITQLFFWRGGDSKMSSERALKEPRKGFDRLSRVILPLSKFWP